MAVDRISSNSSFISFSTSIAPDIRKLLEVARFENQQRSKQAREQDNREWEKGQLVDSFQAFKSHWKQISNIECKYPREGRYQRSKLTRYVRLRLTRLG